MRPTEGQTETLTSTAHTRKHNASSVNLGEELESQLAFYTINNQLSDVAENLLTITVDSYKSSFLQCMPHMIRPIILHDYIISPMTLQFTKIINYYH